MRVWHAMWLRRIDERIAVLQKREEQQHRRRALPRQPEWFVELGIGVGSPPAEVHAGSCYAAGKRRRPVDRDEARRLLASGVRACSHCHPDLTLGVIGLSARPAYAAAAR
ncbi:DUF6233 domain-containing protein [Streptomyces sp. NPDC020707]|uniref:DUF6233 domain-containing protein n=1 Tax=Streptomyces sp. NPDC020707 TaxID=3365084 RepID=UPI0037AE3BED